MSEWALIPAGTHSLAGWWLLCMKNGGRDVFEGEIVSSR